MQFAQATQPTAAQAYTSDCAFDLPFTSVDSATNAVHASLAHLRTADGCLPRSRLQYDIVAAGQRQRIFNYQVALPHFGDEAFLAEAVERCPPAAWRVRPLTAHRMRCPHNHSLIRARHLNTCLNSSMNAIHTTCVQVPCLLTAVR